MPTLNQKIVVKKIMEQVQNGSKVSVTKAMRDSGVYSRATSTRPEKITKSKGYIKLLEEAGLTDKFLAKKHNQLANSSRLERENFEAIKKGNRFVHFTDEQIREAIEGTKGNPTGNRISFIKVSKGMKTALFRVPDNVVQAKALELGLKVKDHLSPERMDIVIHDLSLEEKQALSKLFPSTKK